MTPASFAILTLAALIIVSHLVELAFELFDSEYAGRRADNQTPSHIA